MTQQNAIKLFEQKQVRSVWDDTTEEWYFSVVDVVAILTDSDNPQVYWRVLKKRLLAEGNQTVTNCNAFKMLVPDGKMRKTDSVFDPIPLNAMSMNRKDVYSYVKTQIAKWYEDKVSSIEESDYISNEDQLTILMALRDSIDENSLFELLNGQLGQITDLQYTFLK